MTPDELVAHVRGLVPEATVPAAGETRGQAVVVLHTWFAHRDRDLEGTGGSPVHEVRVVADSVVGSDQYVSARLRYASGLTTIHPSGAAFTLICV